MNYTLLTADRQAAIVESHVQQVEEQHASALIQRQRDEAAGRSTGPIEKLIADLEAEHAALLQARKG